MDLRANIMKTRNGGLLSQINFESDSFFYSFFSSNAKEESLDARSSKNLGQHGCIHVPPHNVGMYFALFRGYTG